MERDWKAGRILIVTAVEAEREAVLRGLQAGAGAQAGARFTVLAAGAGPAAAAAGAAVELAAGASLAAASAGTAPEPSAVAELSASAGDSADARPYVLVVSAGIGGGFPGVAPVGSLVVATDLIAADLGAETAVGFAAAAELGFGNSRHKADEEIAGLFLQAAVRTGLPVCAGPILTVSTATGTAATAAERLGRTPAACAEAMEGYGVAEAAVRFGLPCVELRAISNEVGPRDRGAWRIGEALQALEKAFHSISEVLI